MSAMSCFLCRCNVGEGNMKAKRKRFSGSSAKKLYKSWMKVLQILDE